VRTVDVRTAISIEQLGRWIRELGRCGAQPEGGIIRPQYSKAWLQARDLLAEWMAESGLQVRTDTVGNLYGRLVGRDASRAVLTGSHLDTVRLGGAYDGALGIVTGLAALAAMRASCGTPSRSIEVVALCEEEGSRFHANYFGTRSILGLVERAELDSLIDADGMTLAQAMREVGLDPTRHGESQRHDLEAFLELHIEQGPVLFEEHVDVAVVTGITALCWQTVTVTGRADHAGTTPMDIRKDALRGACRMALDIAEVAVTRGRPAVATVGQWEVQPGGANIVPERVTFSVDLRHPDETVLGQLIHDVRAHCLAAAADLNLQVTVETIKHEVAAPTDQRLQQVLVEAAQVCGASWRHLPSGAGHDAQLFAQHLPSAMLFVPSVEGRSHSAAEYTPDEACVVGAKVLSTALHQLAYD